LSGGTAGDCTTSACPLWASKASLESYDLVVLSCECSQNNQTKPAVSMTALHDWLDEGGRVFANHQQYTWFSNSPSTDFHGTATWSTAGSITNNGSVDDAVDTSYPKGLAYSQWLGAAGALADAGPPPALLLSSVGASASAVSTTPPQATARWVYDPGASDSVRYLTFETPIGGTPGSAEAGAPRYCGKTAFADVHAQGTLLSSASDVPNGCGSNAGMLSAQEKSLEFLFFDLSACVAPDSIAPPGPPPSGP
jgi:hypothetical protein